MARQTKMVSIMFAILILFGVSEIILRSNKIKLSQKGTRVYRNAVAALIIIFLLSSFFFLTDTLNDLLIVVGLFSFLIVYFLILIKEPNIGEPILLFLNFGIWVIWFFVRNIVNRHLLIPINYTIIIIFILIIFKINSRKDKETAKKYFYANGIGILILIGLIFFTKDSYKGISKQEYIARDYMKEYYNIEKEDIDSIWRGETSSNDEKIWVSIKNSDETYFLTYKKGEIIDVKEMK